MTLTFGGAQAHFKQKKKKSCIVLIHSKKKKILFRLLTLIEIIQFITFRNLYFGALNQVCLLQKSFIGILTGSHFMVLNQVIQ